MRSNNSANCQRHPNHHDPVMPSHLLGGEPGSVAKARTAARVVPEIQGTRDDVSVHQQYIADIEASGREALATVDPTPFA